MVYKFFDKKMKRSGFNRPLVFIQQLAKELHKRIIRNFKKGAVYSGFKDDIWGANLVDIQLIIMFNNEFRFLLCVFCFFS